MAETFQIEEPETQKSQAGLTAVCGILGVLLVVLNLRGGDDTEHVVKGPNPKPAAAKAAQPTDGETVVVSRRLTKWPDISVDSLLKNNPFRIRESLDETINGTDDDKKVVAQVRQALKESKSQMDENKKAARRIMSSYRVSMVYHSAGGQPAALVGETVVHVGDTLDGLQVVQILPDGVVVQPIEAW